jgi:hypothetical protein
MNIYWYKILLVIYNLFHDNKINVCLPRGEKRTNSMMFESYSLAQFKKEFYDKNGIEKEDNLPVEKTCIIISLAISC